MNDDLDRSAGHDGHGARLDAPAKPIITVDVERYAAFLDEAEMSDAEAKSLQRDIRSRTLRLENSKEENLPFYRGHGFTVTKEIRFARSAPPLWLMWREPGGR